MDGSNLVDSIYESAFVPELWPDVLHRLAEVAGAKGGLLFTGTFERVLHWTASEALRERAAVFASSDLLRTSGRLPRLLQARHAGFVREHDIYSDDELAQDPVYRDFLWPGGFGWAAGMGIALPTGDALVLSLERLRAAGPVEDEAVQQLDILRPHLARSAFLAARQHLQRAQTAADTLALIGLPAAVIDRSARTVAANRLIDELTDHVAWGAAGRVVLKDRAANQMLAQAAATIEVDVNAPARSFAVRDEAKRPVMVAHVLPLRRSARDIFSRSEAVLILTPVAMSKAPPIELVRSLFDLTPTEASIARGLVAGDSLDDIAQERRVSKETVRTHLRGVMDKTGCRRQAEVVALLSGVALPGAAI